MRILIADDHPLFRRGLRRVLEDNGHEVVAEAADGAEAERFSHTTRPDLVLMDLQMPSVDGVTATRRLAATTPVIVLTVSEENGDLQRAIAAGARGYLLKRAPPGEIMRAIDAVAGGARRHVAGDHCQGICGAAAAAAGEHTAITEQTPTPGIGRRSGGANHP